MALFVLEKLFGPTQLAQLSLVCDKREVEYILGKKEFGF